VDPSYTHPYDAIVEEVMARLDRMVEGEEGGPASSNRGVEDQPE
jgi:hypothetical protein